MILLNLTEEILENAKREGQEVVEVEMTPTHLMEEEADLIRQADTWLTRGHYRTK